MSLQIALDTRDEALLAEEATERGMAAVVNDLNDELTVICAFANLGGDASYDTERTEAYFALIETAGKKAAQIAGRLLVLDPDHPSGHEYTKAVAWPAGEPTIDAAIDPRKAESSFRRRLTTARARQVPAHWTTPGPRPSG